METQQSPDEDLELEADRRNLFIGIAASVLALAVALWGIQPARFVEVFRGANPAYFLPAIGMTLLGLGARSQSWRVLLQKKISLSRSFSALNEGYLLNNSLPLRAGEIGRAFLVSRDSGIAFGEAVASVVVERLVDSIVSLTGLAIAIPFIVGIEWARNVAALVGLVLLIVLLALIVLMTQQNRILRLLERLPRRLGWFVRSEIQTFTIGLKNAFRPTTLLTASFWSTLAWATTWAQLAFIMSAFGLTTTFAANLLIIGVTAFGAALPSSPGAVGVFELATMAGMLAAGFERESSLAVAIAWHLLQVAVTGLLGAYALSREGLTLKSLAASIRSTTQRNPEEDGE